MDWRKDGLGKPVSGREQEDKQRMGLPVCLCQNPVNRQSK